MSETNGRLKWAMWIGIVKVGCYRNFATTFVGIMPGSLRYVLIGALGQSKAVAG